LFVPSVIIGTAFIYYLFITSASGEQQQTPTSHMDIECS